jgi:hypothetical protein
MRRLSSGETKYVRQHGHKEILLVTTICTVIEELDNEAYCECIVIIIHDWDINVHVFRVIVTIIGLLAHGVALGHLDLATGRVCCTRGDLWILQLGDPGSFLSERSSVLTVGATDCCAWCLCRSTWRRIGVIDGAHHGACCEKQRIACAVDRD